MKSKEKRKNTQKNQIAAISSQLKDSSLIEKYNYSQSRKKQFSFVQQTKDESFNGQNQFLVLKKDSFNIQQKRRERLITQHTDHSNKNKLRQSFLPNINKQKLENKKMLIQLYQRRINLSKKLEKINRYIINQRLNTQTDVLKTQENPEQSNVVVNTPKFRKIQKKYTDPGHLDIQAINDFRRGSTIFKGDKKRNELPQSMTSIEKNKQVLQFIKNMHKDSNNRSLKRIQKHNKSVQKSIKDICLNCSRSKCKKQVVCTNLNIKIV